MAPVTEGADMKNLMAIVLCLLASSVIASGLPTWNPEWDTYGTQQQDQQSTNNDRSAGCGHNHQKLPAQGEYDWDHHADRGDMHWDEP